MTSSSRDLAIRPGCSTSTVATMLRRILAWLDRQSPSLQEISVEQPETPVIGAVAEPVPVSECDDGLMDSASIVRAAGNLLWAYRGSLDMSSDIDESQVDRQMHSLASPEITIGMPGGVTIRMPTHPLHYGFIAAPDGQRQSFRNDDASIGTAWRSIQVQAVVDTLGLEDLMVREPDDDGERPHDGHGRALAVALGRFVEQHAPRKSEMKYLSRKLRTYHMVSQDSEPDDEEVETASQWLEMGQDVLMRIAVRAESIHDGCDGGKRSHRHELVVKHPVVGSIVLDHTPVTEGLERRRLMSLTSALGIVQEMPVHLPMPRGNAQAARVLRLCREAVAAEPDLVDSAGTPMRPLVDRHLPELMRSHAAAAVIAPADQLADIDAELAEGIERVRLAVQDALSTSAVARRTALRSQLGFLALRHPDPVPLLEPVPDGDRP